MWKLNEKIKAKLALLPDAPGSYQMLDDAGRIIYVGKAKSLKNRVKSYFSGSHDAKTTNLVANIADFTYIVTSSELEAFLLELSLIKEHAPRFNILLMDDKTYPYIEITREKNPKLVITRKANTKNRLLFGPYPDASSARETLSLIEKLFPFRKCKALPKKVCLYYHLGQCLGPCEYPVSIDVYKKMENDVAAFLSGRDDQVLDDLEKKMEDCSLNKEYEKAGEYRDLIASVKRTLRKQNVIFNDLSDRDIINYGFYDHYLAVSILFMRQGKIIFSENKLVTFYGEPEEAFISYVAQFYELHPLPKEILLPEGPDYELLEPILNDLGFVPKRGKKKELVDMAKENAGIYLENNLSPYLRKSDQSIGAIQTLADMLGIQVPVRIEAFDNSNTMGSDPVSSMVVFTNGLPDRKEYRKYKVKTVVGPDDYNTMKEIVYRRYQRMLVEKSRRPDLIVMDGGLGQVNAACEIIASLELDIPVAGLKKDDRHHTDFLISPNGEEIKLDRHQPIYVLLNKIQEEAHRFAVTFHRDRQSKQVYASYLDKIPSVGKATKEKLLQKYKTLANIAKSDDQELSEIGLTKVQIKNLRIALADLSSQ